MQRPSDSAAAFSATARCIFALENLSLYLSEESESTALAKQQLFRGLSKLTSREACLFVSDTPVVFQALLWRALL